MTHLERVRARQSDPTAVLRWQDRVKTIEARLKASGANAMALLLQDETTVKGKVFWLNKLMDTLASATGEVVPCREGCSHCCNMATEITTDEAKVIAEASGRALLTPAVFNQEPNHAKYEGTPCPLLVDSRCSVYAVRPMACRLHNSVDDDNLLCQIVPGENIRAPSFDTSRFNILGLLAVGDLDKIQYADIREYFAPRPL